MGWGKPPPTFGTRRLRRRYRPTPSTGGAPVTPPSPCEPKCHATSPFRTYLIRSLDSCPSPSPIDIQSPRRRLDRRRGARSHPAPAADIYGAGASIFARYAILDSLELGASAGFYGAQHTKDKRALGLYNIRLGANYVLDVLQWVPWAGIYISSIFSEDTHKKWHKDGHGMGIDFDIGIQYRGIRQFGIGLYFSYHLVFTDTDYMTAGITLQWYSGMF